MKAGVQCDVIFAGCSWPRDISGPAGPSVADTCRPGWGRRWRWDEPGCQDRKSQTELWRPTPLLTLLPEAKPPCCPEKLRKNSEMHNVGRRQWHMINIQRHWITRIHKVFSVMQTVGVSLCSGRMGTKTRSNYVAVHLLYSQIIN